jgi:predicted nucleic acid-binding protein
MILLDTNVVSEMMRDRPDPRTVAWLNNKIVEDLAISTISLSEILLGIASLPDGRRKIGLSQSFGAQVAGLFGSRILSFDVAAAQAYAMLVSQARAQGRDIGRADGEIAAIAMARGLIVASRDTAPFEAAGLMVINPWSIT